MTDGDISAASRKHRLDVDCAIADALLERSAHEANPDPAANAQPRLEAMTLLEESTLPTAVFEVASRKPRLVNAAWRGLFGARDAYSAIPGVDETGRARSMLHHAELALDLEGRPTYLAATLRASRNELDATTCVIVVCADITDEVIARELAVDADALVWSGPLGRDADY